MMRRGIEWLASQPNSAKLLGALAEPEPATPPPREPEHSPHPFAALAAKAAALTERADRLAMRDERWEELRREGYMVESLQEIAQFAAAQGIADPREAARTLERAVGYPEPAVGHAGRRRAFAALDRVEQREHDAAYSALMSGDDEGWLAHSIPAALKEARGG